MQGRSRYLAMLLAIISTGFLAEHPSQAQVLRYGHNRYPKVISVTEDSAGNFLLLNLQNKSALAAPSIQYLPGADGQTILVADFPGLVWSQEPKIFRPANENIASIRLGQFQESPPIFRISVASSNPASMRRLEFRAQAHSLLLRFPAVEKASAKPVVAPAVVAQSAKRIPAVAETRIVSNTLSVLLNQPPFRPGGLYLELGPDPRDLSQSPNAEKYPDKANEAAQKQSSPEAKIAALKQLPPLAPERQDRRDPAFLPPQAPDLKNQGTKNVQPESSPKTDSDKNEETIVSSQRRTALGFGAKLRKLFHSKAEQETNNDTAETKAEKNKQNGEEKSVNSRVSDDDLPPNPQVEFSGNDPFKIRLKFDSSIKYKSFKLDDPPRYVIDIEDLKARFKPILEPDSNPYLKAVRIGNPDEKITRIVFDLSQARVKVKDDCQKQDLVLTLSADTSESPLATRMKEVVLDAGHGGSDPGAQRGDIQEKEITLSITQKLKRYLEERGLKVVMTRSDDSFVSLEDRAKITNQMHPDAFVSIHINSLETDRDIKGIETYYNTDQSRALADKVHEQLVEKLGVPDRSVRRARFYVVNHTDRPAILAEVGFISNKDERDKLISSDYQAKIAESVGQGVILYLANASGPATAAVSATETGLAKAAGFTSSRTSAALAKQGQSAVKQITVEQKSGREEQVNSRQIAQSESRQKRKEN